jgi:hypothetical protein
VKLPDEIDVTIQQHEEDSETAIPEIALRTAISFIPYAGSAINEITSGLAQRRVQQRLNDVFDALKCRLGSLGEEKVDREYFHSEEFQSVLYLLLERLHTTHDKEKLRMFGNALGNSGVVEFKAADKEEFVRVLRDLSLSDLTILNDENLKGWRPHMHEFVYGPDILPSLFRLQGMGLVLAKLSDKQPITGRTGSQQQDAINMLSELLTKPPKMTFYLSKFGTKFLSFISSDDTAHGDDSSS